MILPDGAVELIINLGDPQKLCHPDDYSRFTSFRHSWISGEGDKLVREFQEIHPDGRIDALVARVTSHGTESWDNAILARKDGALTPLVQVQYLAAR